MKTIDVKDKFTAIAWDKMVLPGIGLLIVAIIGYGVSNSSMVSALAQEVKDHKAQTAHDNTRQLQITELKGRVNAVHIKIDGLVSEQRQVNKRLEERIDLKMQLILNEVKSIKRGQ